MISHPPDAVVSILMWHAGLLPWSIVCVGNGLRSFSAWQAKRHAYRQGNLFQCRPSVSRGECYLGQWPRSNKMWFWRKRNSMQLSMGQAESASLSLPRCSNKVGCPYMQRQTGSETIQGSRLLGGFCGGILRSAHDSSSLADLLVLY